MKLPAFQFYPADWRKDPGVQSLSYHDRGVWLEIICLMHESEQRGKLLLNGKSMPEDALARLLGLDKQIVTKTITTLLEYGVASLDQETGALVCRRMVRDEDLRKIRQEAGKMGGNPVLLKQKDNQKVVKMVKQKPTPSSSSSITSSELFAKHLALLCECCELSTKTMGMPSLSRLDNELEEMRACGMDLLLLSDFRRWWNENDWRGNKGQAPTVSQVRSEWEKFEKFRAVSNEQSEHSHACPVCQDTGSVSVFEGREFVRYADCKCQSQRRAA